MKRRFALVTACALSGAMVGACSSGDSGDLTVAEAWTRATPPGAEVAAFYLTVDNGADTPDELLSATSPRCAMAELHRSEVVDDLMQMGPATAQDLTVDAGQEMVFEPTGLHVMCMGMTEPIVDGDQIELTLEFANAGRVVTTVTVGEP